jgi:hypothetical protein
MSLLSAIGGLVGLAYGGPMFAALGSGIGTLASGGDFKDALKSGLMGYGIGSIPGVSGLAAKGAGALGLEGLSGQFAAQQATQKAALAKMAPGLSKIGTGITAGAGGAPAASATVGSGIFGPGMVDNLVLAGLIQAGEPKPIPLTPLQQQQRDTGERAPNYQGIAAADTRFMNVGGMIAGPGTGKSDSIPAAIYQNGGRVQEARLSDGEFVMTADAVKGAGDGNRAKGAAEMYKMMNRFERSA